MTGFKLAKRSVLLIAGLAFPLSTPLFYGAVVAADGKEVVRPKIDWDKWDEKNFAQALASGTIDPAFKEFLNREPQRIVPKQENVIVAPADGTLQMMEMIGEYAVLTIETGLWDVHIQRIPLAGKILSVEKKEKGLLPEVADAHLTKGFQVITTLRTDIGLVKIMQIAEFTADCIITSVTPGQKVRAGDKLGKILSQSTVMLILPGHVKPEKVNGGRVFAGRTIIARY